MKSYKTFLLITKKNSSIEHKICFCLSIERQEQLITEAKQNDFMFL
jgi:hypothetical protein